MRAVATALGLMMMALPARAEGDFARFVSAVEQAMGQASAGGAPCPRFVADGFDLGALSRGVADDAWEGMAAGTREALREAVGKRLVQECASRARRNEAGSVSVLKSRLTDSGASLSLKLTGAQGDEHQLSWRLRAGGPWGWTATDMVGDGRSVLGTLRDEFKGALSANDGDVGAAIARVAGK